MDIIEDIIPLSDVPVSLRLPGRICNATLVPQGEPLAFTEKDGRVEFTIPRITGHQMVCLEEV